MTEHDARAERRAAHLAAIVSRTSTPVTENLATIICESVDPDSLTDDELEEEIAQATAWLASL